MDEGIKQAYKMFAGLDVDKCERINTTVGKQIVLPDRTIDLVDFLQETGKIMVIDSFDSRDTVKSPDLKNKYMALVRKYFYYTQDNKGIGYSISSVVHNGFPGLVNSEEFIENPAETWKKSVEQMNKELGTAKGFFNFLKEPEQVAKGDIGLLPEYIKLIR